MTDILVLEDEQTAREALVKILENCSPDIRVRAAATLEEARRLLAENRTYGLFLLDVNLSGNDREDIGGILFAREVREQFRYSFTPIVMVTAIGAMEMQAYRELHCYQYMMKPYGKTQVEELLRKVLEHRKREQPPVVTVKKDGINYQVQCSEIVYLEAVPRGLRIHMKSQTWDVPYLTLKQMLLRLPEEMFLQCHRMYAVNRQEVEYFDTVNRIVKMKNCQDTVEIGVTYRAEIGRLIQ